MGIVRDDFVLTDNFADYGFDSTDPMSNLQMIFIVMVLLLMFSVYILFMRCICFWSDKCKRCLNWMHRIIFWNPYLRFALEAYLELSVSSMLRFNNLQFSTASEIFHTIFSVTILVFLCGYLVFAVIKLQVSFKRV